MPNFNPSTLPGDVLAAFKLGALGWPLMVQRALAVGIKDLDKLASLVFYMHHPERNGKPIAANEPKLINEWKAFRVMIAPLIGYMPKPSSPKPSGSTTPKSNPELESVLAQLDQFKLDGKLTERQKNWAVAIAEDALGAVDDLEDVVSFTSDLADLVIELPLTSATGLTGLGLASGCLALAAPFLMFMEFAEIIGDSYETDLRMYRAVAVAYTITGWAFDERRMSSPTMRNNIITGTMIGSGRTGEELDEQWRVTYYMTNARMMKVVRGVGTATAEKNIKLILKTKGKQKLARAILLALAGALPAGKRTEQENLERFARDVSYPN